MFMHIQVIQGCRLNVGFDSVHLGWSLSSCISTKLPRDADAVVCGAYFAYFMHSWPGAFMFKA